MVTVYDVIVDIIRNGFGEDERQRFTNISTSLFNTETYIDCTVGITLNSKHSLNRYPGEVFESLDDYSIDTYHVDFNVSTHYTNAPNRNSEKILVISLTIPREVIPQFFNYYKLKKQAGIVNKLIDVSSVVEY